MTLPERKRIHLIGAGGHAKVVIQTARAIGYEPVSLFDDNEQLHGHRICDVPIIGNIDSVRDSDIPCVIAIGKNERRKWIAENYNLNWVSLIHPAAVVDPSVKIGPGTVIFALAVVQADVKIGSHVIVNTSASIDHDCIVGDFSHIAPGTHLSGNVILEEGVMLGVGSCGKPSIKVGCWTIVGAGAAVVSDIPDNVTAVGVPAKVIHKNQ